MNLNEIRLEKLEKYGRNCEEELKVIGLSFPKPIKYEITNRTTRCWGQCITSKNWNYTIIRISGWLLDDEIPDKTLHQNILHELAHAVDDNKNGHKGRWLELAELISDCYGVDIKRLVTTEQLNTVKETEVYKTAVTNKRRKLEYKWEYECPKCEKIYKDKRKPKYLKYNPNTKEINYCCGTCKGTKLILTKHGDMSKVGLLCDYIF